MCVIYVSQPFQTWKGNSCRCSSLQRLKQRWATHTHTPGFYSHRPFLHLACVWYKYPSIVQPPTSSSSPSPSSVICCCSTLASLDALSKLKPHSPFFFPPSSFTKSRPRVRTHAARRSSLRGQELIKQHITLSHIRSNTHRRPETIWHTWFWWGEEAAPWRLNSGPKCYGQFLRLHQRSWRTSLCPSWQHSCDLFVWKTVVLNAVVSRQPGCCQTWYCSTSVHFHFKVLRYFCEDQTHVESSEEVQAKHGILSFQGMVSIKGWGIWNDHSGFVKTGMWLEFMGFGCIFRCQVLLMR